MNSPARIAAVLSSLLPFLAHAGGYALPHENARDLALSEAAVSNQTGPEAIYLNPAALSGQEGFAISASLELLSNTTVWTDPTLGTATTDPKINTPPTAAMSFGGKIGGVGLGVGLGMGVMGGGSLVWPKNWAGVQRVQSVNQQIFTFEGGVAIQPVSFLQLGGSVIYFRAVEQLSQQLGFVSSTGTADLGLAGGAVGFGASAQVNVPGVPLAFAVNYRHKADLTLNGRVHFDGVPATYQGLLQDQGVSARLLAPNVLTAGAFFELPKRVAVMAAYTFERWTEYQQDQFVGDQGFSVTVPRNYKDAHVVRLAVEWNEAFTRALTLRLGGLRSLSPQPTDTLSPSLTDGNSWGISAGVGFQFIRDVLRVDVGYQHAFFDPVSASGAEAFPGTYKTQVDLVSLGLNLRI